MPHLHRRTFLSLSGGTTLSVAASAQLWASGTIPMPASKDEVEEKLDSFTAAGSGSGVMEQRSQGKR